MARVCFLGLGKMGGAMCRRLCEKGIGVVAWNRSVSKAEAIAAEMGGVCTVASSPAEALRMTAESSALIVMVMSSTEATLQVLEEVVPLLKGRDVTNLASGNPDEGRRVARYLKDNGVTGYIDGAYCGPPSKARAGAGILFLSAADRGTVASWDDVLSVLGTVKFAGDIGASRALDYAVVDLVMMNLLSYLSNTEMLEREGVDPSLFFECAGSRLSTVPAALEMYTERMKDRSDEAYRRDPTATVASWRHFFASRLPYHKERAIPTDIPDFVISMLDKAAEGGHGDDDVSRLQEVVRYK